MLDCHRKLWYTNTNTITDFTHYFETPIFKKHLERIKKNILNGHYYRVINSLHRIYNGWDENNVFGALNQLIKKYDPLNNNQTNKKMEKLATYDELFNNIVEQVNNVDINIVKEFLVLKDSELVSRIRYYEGKMQNMSKDSENYEKFMTKLDLCNELLDRKLEMTAHLFLPNVKFSFSEESETTETVEATNTESPKSTEKETPILDITTGKEKIQTATKKEPIKSKVEITEESITKIQPNPNNCFKIDTEKFIKFVNADDVKAIEDAKDMYSLILASREATENNKDYWLVVYNLFFDKTFSDTIDLGEKKEKILKAGESGVVNRFFSNIYRGKKGRPFLTINNEKKTEKENYLPIHILKGRAFVMFSEKKTIEHVDSVVGSILREGKYMIQGEGATDKNPNWTKAVHPCTAQESEDLLKTWKTEWDEEESKKLSRDNKSIEQSEKEELYTLTGLAVKAKELYNSGKITEMETFIDDVLRSGKYTIETKNDLPVKGKPYDSKAIEGMIKDFKERFSEEKIGIEKSDEKSVDDFLIEVFERHFPEGAKIEFLIVPREDEEKEKQTTKYVVNLVKTLYKSDKSEDVRDADILVQLFTGSRVPKGFEDKSRFNKFEGNNGYVNFTKWLKSDTTESFAEFITNLKKQEKTTVGKKAKVMEMIKRGLLESYMDKPAKEKFAYIKDTAKKEGVNIEYEEIVTIITTINSIKRETKIVNVNKVDPTVWAKFENLDSLDDVLEMCLLFKEQSKNDGPILQSVIKLFEDGKVYDLSKDPAKTEKNKIQMTANEAVKWYTDNVQSDTSTSKKDEIQDAEIIKEYKNISEIEKFAKKALKNGVSVNHLRTNSEDVGGFLRNGSFIDEDGKEYGKTMSDGEIDNLLMKWRNELEEENTETQEESTESNESTEENKSTEEIVETETKELEESEQFEDEATEKDESTEKKNETDEDVEEKEKLVDMLISDEDYIAIQTTKPLTPLKKVIAKIIAKSKEEDLVIVKQNVVEAFKTAKGGFAKKLKNDIESIIEAAHRNMHHLVKT